MRIAVVGTGPVGKALAAGLDGIGHDVVVGTRDVTTTLARTEPDTFGNPAFGTWRDEHPGIDLASLPDVAAGSDLVVNATNGAGSLDALDAVGADHLSGKVLVDVANPLDFSGGMPPTLLVANTDSLGERIQRRYPRARVVKTLNTMNASLMVDPGRLAGGDHTVFVSGDDSDAKREVDGLLRALGWVDVVDLGGIATARGPEMYLPLWAGLWGALGTPMFTIKVVRDEAARAPASGTVSSAS